MRLSHLLFICSIIIASLACGCGRHRVDVAGETIVNEIETGNKAQALGHSPTWRKEQFTQQQRKRIRDVLVEILHESNDANTLSAALWTSSNLFWLEVRSFPNSTELFEKAMSRYHKLDEKWSLELATTAEGIVVVVPGGPGCAKY